MTTTNQNPATEIENLGWDNLVALKRRLSGRIKELSEKIIDIERNKMWSINDNIHVNKNNLDIFMQRIKQIRSEVQAKNSELFSVSERISQSKNFLSMMESRVANEGEANLFHSLNKLQEILDQKQYRTSREKNEIQSLVKETSMKIEALKAIRTIKDQMRELDVESENIRMSLKLLDEEQQTLQLKISQIKNIMDEPILFKTSAPC